MAVTKITWENKTGIQNDASVARKNKVVDEDMNEIKQVVNNNADEVTTMQETIEDLQEGQGTASTDITNLKNRVSTLETDNTKNKSDISKLKTDNETNKLNISELQKQFSNFENYDDTEIKQDIEDIKQEQEEQNANIENLQTNDNKQDELISKLKNATLNAETEESKSIHVEDANKFGQLEVLGNHGQKTRDGYNILPNNLTNTTINGVTFTINEDKSVTVNGTATASIIANLITGKYNDNNASEPLTISDTTTNCRLSGCPSGGSNSTYKLDLWTSNGVLKGTDYGEGINISISSDNDRELKRARIIIYAGATVNNLTFKPMLVTGTEEKPYEQYGASPSSDYPSPVKCLGSNKNEFNGSNAYNGYITGKVGQKISYQSSTLSKTYKSCCKLIKNKNYTLSFNKNNPANTNVKVCAIADEDENILETFNLNPAEETLIITSTNTGYLYLVMDINATNIKIEEGTEATSYSPPGQGSTKISKINKNIYDITKYPFTNRIAYNSSGKQVFWTGYCGILDYFPVKGNTQYTFSNNLNKPIYCGLVFYNKDKQVISAISTNTTTFTTPENCKYIRFAIQSDTLPTWVQIEVGNTATSNVEHQQEDYLLYIQQEMLEGDYFVKEEDGWKEVHGWNKIESYNGESITTEYISTTGELTIGATIFYKTEQYKLPCTEEQIAVLEELNNLDLYKPVTNIITTEDIALLKLKYALDVKTYVDNQLANVNQQILNIAGGN